MDPSSDNHPLNLNSPNFDSEAYVNNLIQKKSLDELVAVEEDMVQNVRRLDSEMQQLVYENYNKFLTATATVRSMQTAFAEMDNEVRGLSERMRGIAELSDSLLEMFSNNRAAVRKLTENSKTIQRLQYFVKLPQILQESIDEQNYKKAIEIYVNVLPKLKKYKDTKSMSGIYSDCNKLMEAQEKRWQDALIAKTFSADAVLEAAQSLRRLGHPESEIRAQLLSHWRTQLGSELDELDAQVRNVSPLLETPSNTEPKRLDPSSDVLGFVDRECCTFLTNLSLYVSVFVQLFRRPEDRADLMELVENSMRTLEGLLLRRFASEMNSRDCALFVKALDRISRKIAVFSRVLPGMDFSRMNAIIVVNAAEHEIKLCRNGIKRSVHHTIMELQSTLKNGTYEVPSEQDDNDTGKASEKLGDSVMKMEQAFLVSVKTGLANLLLFTANDMNFSTIDPVYFGSSGTFSMNVFENVVAGSLSDLGELAKDLRTLLTDDRSVPADVFLVFGAFLQNLRAKHVNYIVDLSQEQFMLMELKHAKSKSRLTSLDSLMKQLKSMTSDVLRDFVDAECTSLDTVIVKSFGEFDWASVLESPKSVRSLAKYFLHCLESTSHKIRALTGENLEPKSDLPSDSAPSLSIRRAASAASSTLTNTYESASLGGSSIDAGGAIGIMGKLWSDEPDDQPLNLLLDRSDPNAPATLAELISAATTSPLDFRHKYIVGAVVRVCLRRVVQCLARSTFSTFGLQQLQLDCAYLRCHLLNLAFDEHVLSSLIEECITAGVSQCAEPLLLEPTVVRAICDS